MLHLRLRVHLLQRVEVTILAPIPPHVIALFYQQTGLKSRPAEKDESSLVFSGIQRNVSLSRAPLYKFHFPTGMRGRVQGQARSPPQHLLLEFNDIIAEVSHHQEEEVKRAGWSLPKQGDRSFRRTLMKIQIISTRTNTFFLPFHPSTVRIQTNEILVRELLTVKKRI